MSSTTEQGMYRVFKLIRLLNSSPRRSYNQLIRALNTSSSSLSRDLKLLERLGYLIEKDRNNCYFLQLQMPRNNRKESILDADELFFLQDHLQQTAGNSPQAQAILHKFDRNLSMIPLADALPFFERIIQINTHTGVAPLHRIETIITSPTDFAHFKIQAKPPPYS